MLKDSEILEGINAVICAGFPERPVYVNVQTEELKRPSFFITSGRKTARPAGFGLVRRTAAYTVTVLEKTDEATGLCSLEALQDTQAAAAALFFGPFPCGDRVLTASAELAPVDDALNAEFTLSLEFYDDDGRDGGETEPLMRGVHTREKINNV